MSGVISWKTWDGSDIKTANWFSSFMPCEYADVYCLISELNTSKSSSDKLTQAQKQHWLEYVDRALGQSSLHADYMYLYDKIEDLIKSKIAELKKG